jgi:hypothetical protein
MSSKPKNRPVEIPQSKLEEMAKLHRHGYRVSKLAFRDPATGREKCQFRKDLQDLGIQKDDGTVMDARALSKINSFALSLRTTDSSSQGIRAEGGGVYSLPLTLANKRTMTMFFGIEGDDRFLLGLGMRNGNNEVGRARQDALESWESFRANPAMAKALPVIASSQSLLF